VMNGNGPSPTNGLSSATLPAPYRKGWRAPWRGQWGPITDGNSRLGRLADRIERQLVTEYDTTRPLWASKIREVAELKALAQRARDLLGIDPKVTLRQITAASMAAERLLSKVAHNGGARTLTPDQLLDRAHEALREDREARGYGD
jgi:hypothetical protein